MGERHNGIVEVTGSSPVRSTKRTIRRIVLFLYRLGKKIEVFLIASKIKLSSPQELSILWDDEHASIISLRTLRDHCPCAGCQGETVLLKTYTPEPQPQLPGRYNLIGIQQVGHYAIQISWGDGHSTGIYTWDYLRNLCECSSCL
jgi:DUF971 family protein